ncbi:MAG: tetratricopeptide repeat protein [Elusimicrobiota bacterium]|nr:tetratricopeptide repeat protein [Elusimicrobiota bacterium]
MRERSRANALIFGAVLIIGVCAAIYATVFLKWVSAPRSGAAEASLKAAAAKAEAALVDARRGFRSNLLDARAHLRLSEALWKAGRHVDSFFVAVSARELLGDDAFRAAHGAVVLKLGGPAAELRKRLAGVGDPAKAVPVHAEVARLHPDTAEGRDSLDTLTRLAQVDETSGGEAARLARAALEELHRSDPKHPGKLAAFALAALGRGDPGLAQAIANEALAADPNHAGAALAMGALALHLKEPDKAFPWLSLAWDRNPDDLYSAAKLAQLYDKRRNDPEAALPFWLAIHRQNPDYEDGGPVERRIREVLDARRERLLAHAGVESLGRYFTHEDGAIRAEAAARAAEYKDPRWIDALGTMLDDDVELVRRSADYALFKIGQQEPEAVRARRDEWLAGDKPLTRIRALNLYADLDGRNAYPRALAALKDPVPAVRAFAKLMVLDYYYGEMPEATKARAKYLAEERDPEAQALLARFAPGAARAPRR